VLLFSHFLVGVGSSIALLVEVGRRVSLGLSLIAINYSPDF